MIFWGVIMANVEVVYPASVYVLGQIAHARLAVSLSELKYDI